jgi:propanediol dehydratase small subunit
LEKLKTMMIKFAAGCILIGTVLASIAAQAAAPAAAPAAGPTCKYPVASAKGAEITAHIKARLAEVKVSSLADITVDTDDKGAVLMCGKVKSEQEADTIIFNVHRVPGVTAVRSDFDMPGD